MKAIGFGSDGSFSWEDLSARYNAELANGFGNLASRSIAMVKKYFDGVIPSPGNYTAQDQQVIAVALKAATEADAAIDQVAIHEAIQKTWLLVDELNNYITVTAPWVLAKDEADRERLATVLYVTIEGLRVLNVLLAPVMPKATAKLWAAIGQGKLSEQTIASAAQWGITKPGNLLGELEALFPRVDQAE
jgi:methionyl-tRNA synthetase